MIITALHTVVTRPDPRPWLFVEIETDAGVVGVGEASQSRSDRGVAEQVAALGRRLIGKEPVGRSGPLVAELLRDPFAGRVHFAAASAVEQALWDLAGKALGVPCRALFGGALSDRIPLYANLALASPSSEPGALAATAERAARDGFGAVKIYPLGGAGKAPDRTMPDWSAAHKRTAAVRTAVGSDVRIMVDLAWNARPGDDRRIADLAGELDLHWVEEPFQNAEASSLRDLKAKLPTRLAGGEQRLGLAPFAALIGARALDVVMPDVKWVGGMGVARDVCALAEAAGIEASLHNMSGPVATAASAQVAAASPASIWLEYCWGVTSWRAALVRETEQIDGGCLVLSDRPGLGIEWDREAVRAQAALIA